MLLFCFYTICRVVDGHNTINHQIFRTFAVPLWNLQVIPSLLQKLFKFFYKIFLSLKINHLIHIGILKEIRPTYLSTYRSIQHKNHVDIFGVLQFLLQSINRSLLQSFQRIHSSHRNQICRVSHMYKDFQKTLPGTLLCHALIIGIQSKILQLPLEKNS